MREFFVSAFVLCALLCSNALLAEEEKDPKGFFAGAKIGPGAAFVLGEGARGTEAAVGMGLSLSAMYRFMDYLAFQAELGYEMKGYGVKDMDARGILHYFSVPLLLKGVFDVSPILIQPYGGLDLSILMKATASGSGVEVDITDSLDIFDLGIIFGAEVFYEVVDNLFVTGDLRFGFGFLGVAKDVPYADNFTNGNFNALFGIAYKF
ncbi:MAG TPA: outer membrane beta-barrel protein [bacterium]|nr:outer membrane beta-barrel protein [bacterium]